MHVQHQNAFRVDKNDGNDDDENIIIKGWLSLNIIASQAEK